MVKSPLPLCSYPGELVQVPLRHCVGHLDRHFKECTEVVEPFPNSFFFGLCFYDSLFCCFSAGYSIDLEVLIISRSRDTDRQKWSKIFEFLRHKNTIMRDTTFIMKFCLKLMMPIICQSEKRMLVCLYTFVCLNKTKHIKKT